MLFHDFLCISFLEIYLLQVAHFAIILHDVLGISLSENQFRQIANCFLFLCFKFQNTLVTDEFLKIK